MITLPDIKFKNATLEIRRSIDKTQLGAASVNLLEIVDPVWEVKLKTKKLSYRDKLAFLGWAQQMKNGIGEPVLFHNPNNPYPLAHYSNNAPAEVNGTITAVTAPNEITVSGISPDLVLQFGDNIGFENVHRHIGAFQTETGAGASRTFTIDPPLPHDMAIVGTVVSFVRPSILMALEPDSISHGDDPSSPVSLTLVEIR